LQLLRASCELPIADDTVIAFAKLKAKTPDSRIGLLLTLTYTSNTGISRELPPN